MKVIWQEVRACPFCAHPHIIETVELHEQNIFKGVSVEYVAKYDHCPVTGELFESEDMLAANDIRMKDAYRKAIGRMTTDEIKALRQKYVISQSDLSILLGWGEKTIARYEGHQVQDEAHDAILRKLEQDPEWFLQFLEDRNDKLPADAFRKYKENAEMLFSKSRDLYCKKSLFAEYAALPHGDTLCGNRSLSIEKVVDAIRYIASSAKVTKLYMVRLWKMLWYADALSYKWYDHSITGLAYQSLPMGAVPIGYKLILGLNEVEYDEIPFHESTGFRFTPVKGYEPAVLTGEDIDVLETVIDRVQGLSTEDLVNKMHDERAYQETPHLGIIPYRFAKDLSFA